MNSPASGIGVRRGIRTIVQTLAGGGFTLLVEVFAGTLDPFWRLVVMGLSTAAVALAQNYLEAAGKIPVLLPMPGLVVAPAADVAVATVDAVADAAGGIVGDVTDTAGDIIGAVTGQTNDEQEHNP